MSSPLFSTPRRPRATASASQSLDPPASSQKTYSQRQDLANNSRYFPVATQARNDLARRLAPPPSRDPNRVSILDEVEPTPAPPSFVPDCNDPSPKNPFRTLRQVEMYNAFMAAGPMGIARFLYEEAEAQLKKGPSKHWSRVYDDCDERRWHIPFLLYTLSDAVIESCIKSTLAYDIENTPEVRRFYQRYMKVSGYPAIYSNMITYPKVSIAGTHPHAGTWFTPRELEKVLDAYLGYIDDTNPILNDAIDGMFGGRPGSRPWAKNPRQQKIGKEWIEEARKQYIDNVDPKDMDTHHVKCPMEVGWAHNVQERMPQHAENSSTTYIFGFINAFTRLPTTKGGFGFNWRPQGSVLFPIYTSNTDLAAVAEILGSLLSGTYWYHGGLNATEAGTAHVDLYKNRDGWKRARADAAHRLDFCQAPDALILRMADLSDCLDAYRLQEQDRKELQDLKDELREAYAKNKALTPTDNEKIGKFSRSSSPSVIVLGENPSKTKAIILKHTESAQRMKEYRRRLRSTQAPRSKPGSEQAPKRRLLAAATQIDLTPEEEIEVAAKEKEKTARVAKHYEEFKKRKAASKVAPPNVEASPSWQSDLPLRSQDSASEREAHSASSSPLL
ncbi:MAG: hypothetical protein Q9207_002678 [Kuettlingeria erythrocarpa]